LAVLPLALASTGSFVSISGAHGSYGYTHGDVHHAAHAPAHPAPAPHPAPAYAPEPKPYVPAPAPTYKPAPVYKPVHHAPAYGHHAPAYGHHAPAYGHGYGYEHPKHNCSVVDVTEIAEVCTPTVETFCVIEKLPIKVIVDKEFCYDVSRTVCTESIEEIPQEVCSYDYSKKYEATTAQTVTVSFRRETNIQMVTVCQPGHHGYGHGHHGYGHHGYGGYGGYGKYCKEVEQETAYNVPVVTPVDVAVKVSYPDPFKTCVDKPILLPRVTCEILVEEKCILVPEVMDDTEEVEKCQTRLGAPDCNDVELTLPKQVCVELVYGYAHEEAPAYGKAPHH